LDFIFFMAKRKSTQKEVFVTQGALGQKNT